MAKDQREFGLAVDSLTSSHRLDPLIGFQDIYPESEWTPRAITIVRYVRELEQRKKQLEENREQMKQQDLELDSQVEKNQLLAAELEELTSLNHQLTEQITQLKGLLIQLEQRSQ